MREIRSPLGGFRSPFGMTRGKGEAGEPPVGPTAFTVLDSDGNSFAAPFAVLDSDGNSFTVPQAVLDSDGNSFNVLAA